MELNGDISSYLGEFLHETIEKKAIGLFFDRVISKSEKFCFDSLVSLQLSIHLIAVSDLMHDPSFFHSRLATWVSKSLRINELLVDK